MTPIIKYQTSTALIAPHLSGQMRNGKGDGKFSEDDEVARRVPTVAARTA